MPGFNLTAQQRRDVSIIANAARWAGTTREQRSAATAKARAALDQKYLDRVEPDMGIVDEGERAADRQRRADMLRRADGARNRLKAASRRGKSGPPS